MKKLLLTLLFGILGIGVYGQTIKSLGYNTTNGRVIYNGTNTLTFTNPVVVGGDIVISNSFLTFGAASIDLEEAQLEILGSPVFQWGETELTASVPLAFNTTTNAAITRTNLGLGATWLTNTNAANFRTNISAALATYDGVADNAAALYDAPNALVALQFYDSEVTLDAGYVDPLKNALGLGASWLTNTNVTDFRTAIGLGSTNVPVFSNVSLGNFSGGTLIVSADAAGNLTKNAQLASVFGTTYFLGNVGSDLTNWTAAAARTNLGLGATWLANTNVTNFRTAIGMGQTNEPVFKSVSAFDGQLTDDTYVTINSPLSAIIIGNFQGTKDVFYFLGAQERSIARTNLGLGGGITTNRTFVSYDGTNYTTNSVTISNGIITGWSQ